MHSKANETKVSTNEFHERKREIAEAIREAMRNHPPLKEDIHRILNGLNETFPELQALKGPMSRLPGVITQP